MAMRNVGPELRRAIEKWDSDVEAKAVKFIEAGCSPSEALTRAANVVKHERQERSRKPSRRNNG